MNHDPLNCLVCSTAEPFSVVAEHDLVAYHGFQIAKDNNTRGCASVCGHISYATMVHQTRRSREQRVRDLIAKWQPRFGLQAWDIRYAGSTSERPSETEEAVVYCDDAEQLAQVYLSDDLLDADLEGNVIHELIHVLMRHHEQVAGAAAGAIGGSGATLLIDLLDDEQERIINRITEAITGRRAVSHRRKSLHGFTAWGDAA